ncbi:g2743 [Coccomyxa elongata]
MTVESACTVPDVDWIQLEKHGCLVREDICVDQNRFITFDKRLQPGADFEEGLIFDHFGFHNIPGFPDNVRGAKTRFFPVLQRGNSTADPPDIQSPSFQACQVPLIWWPWWPFNPADVYLNSVLPLERMLREGVIDNQVWLVPVLDGLQTPRFYEWWFAPLSQQPVMPLGDLSARTRAGSRCFKRMLFCNLPGLWKQPFDQNWTAGLQPSLVGQKIVDHYIPERSPQVKKAIAAATSGTVTALKVAFIERRKSRHILNLKDLINECNELTVGEAFDLRAVQCTAVSFDDVGNFTALLAELQTIDILVGVHGAGLVNTYFLRPGAAFVEIFPCRFAHPSLLFWPSQYFWHPHRQEQRILPFQIHMKDETRCKPSQLEKHPAAVNYREGPSFVQATLARDQDVAPNFKAISEVVSRYARFASSARSVASMLDGNSASHFIVES